MKKAILHLTKKSVNGLDASEVVVDLGEVTAGEGETLTYKLINDDCSFVITTIHDNRIELVTHDRVMSKTLETHHKIEPKHLCELRNSIRDISAKLEILLVRIE